MCRPTEVGANSVSLPASPVTPPRPIALLALLGLTPT